MAESVVVNSELKLRVSYTASMGVDPIAAPTVQSINSLNVVTSLGSATKESTGVYYITWTPTVTGTFTIRFTASFIGASSPFITNINLIVVASLDNIAITSTLSEDKLAYFIYSADPMFIDVEQPMLLFTEASEIEVAELIYCFSQEAINIMGNSTPTPLMREFVLASVACSLNRIYDISGGADESTLTLGDLTITRRSSVKAKVTRANATTWCELAGVLRNELYRFTSNSGIKAIVKGTRVIEPMPGRQLQRAEWREL